MSKVYMTIRTPYDDQANKTIKVFTKEEDAEIWMYGMAAKYLFDEYYKKDTFTLAEFFNDLRKHTIYDSLGKNFLGMYTEFSDGDIGIYDSEVME